MVFTNTLAGLYSITLTTSSPAVDFTSAVLSGLGGPYNLVEIDDDGTNEYLASGEPDPLGASQYTLTINGNNSGAGSLGGSITIRPSAVPEPATWAMMLFGFGAVGFAMRRRRSAGLGASRVSENLVEDEGGSPEPPFFFVCLRRRRGARAPRHAILQPGFAVQLVNEPLSLPQRTSLRAVAAEVAFPDPLLAEPHTTRLECRG